MSKPLKVMGIGQTRKMKSLSDEARRGSSQVAAFLAQMDKWGVDASTQFDPKVQADRWLSFIPGQEQHMISGFVIKAGPQGVQWLLDKGFEPDFIWYNQAINSALEDLDKTFDAIEAAGVSPHNPTDGNSLWHMIGFAGNWDQKAVEWARSRNVDWHAFNDQNRQPLHSLIYSINSSAGITDFFSPSGPMGFLSGVMGSILDFSSDLKDQKDHRSILEDIAVEMVKSGVSLYHKDKDGVAPIDNILPEQSRAERYFHNQADPSLSDEEKSRFVISQMMGNKSAVDDMRQDPAAYGSDQLSFIQRLEQASNAGILNTPTASPKRRVP